MKKMLFILMVLIVFSSALSAQVVNADFFPEDNWIDRSFSEDLDNMMGPPTGMTMLIGQYIELWEDQMYLELDRLASVLDEKGRDKLRESHHLWVQAFSAYNQLISENININWLGLMPLQEYQISVMDTYREKAASYYCLYYTILDHRDEGLDYESMELAE